MTTRDLVVKVHPRNVVAAEVVLEAEAQVDHPAEAGHVVEVMIIEERKEEHQEVTVEVEAEVHLLTREVDLEVGDILHILAQGIQIQEKLLVCSD